MLFLEAGVTPAGADYSRSFSDSSSSRNPSASISLIRFCKRLSTTALLVLRFCSFRSLQSPLELGWRLLCFRVGLAAEARSAKSMPCVEGLIVDTVFGAPPAADLKSLLRQRPMLPNLDASSDLDRNAAATAEDS